MKVIITLKLDLPISITLGSMGCPIKYIRWKSSSITGVRTSDSS